MILECALVGLLINIPEYHQLAAKAPHSIAKTRVEPGDRCLGAKCRSGLGKAMGTWADKIQTIAASLSI